jgi:hypothetical protein
MALVILAIGGLLVAGLVGWALTRTVDRPLDTTSTAATAAPMPASDTQSGFPSATSSSEPFPTATGANATTSQPPPAQGEDKAAVRRISAEDLREKMKSGTVAVVDVRDANSYANAHIAGAIHMPLSSVQANLDLLPKGKEIVSYCT